MRAATEEGEAPPTCGLHMLAFMAVKAGAHFEFFVAYFFGPAASREIAGKFFSFSPGLGLCLLIKIGHKLWA